MTSPSARGREQRRRDLEHRLAHDVDLWVATASAAGEPHLVPLSFHWDGVTVLLATGPQTPTARNLAAGGPVRLAVGLVRDVYLLIGRAESLPMAAIEVTRADEFAERTGFDPRTLSTPYRWLRVTPERVHAWREVDEIADRTLMQHGRWLD